MSEHVGEGVSTGRFWIAVGLTIVLIAFLVVAFFKKAQLTSSQQQILRFLCSLCGGFAGAIFTGEALARVEIGFDIGGKLLASGTAGFALFIIVWFTFKTVVAVDHRVAVSIVSGWTFSMTAQKLAESDQKVAVFEGFAPEQLEAPLKPAEIAQSTTRAALLNLRYLVAAPGFPEYSVETADGRYTIKRV